MRKHIPWAHLLINLLPYLAILFLLISALLFSQWLVYEHRISAVLNDEQAVWKSATDASCFLSDTVFPMDRHADSLVFAEDSYLYEYTNGQTRIRCTKNRLFTPG